MQEIGLELCDHDINFVILNMWTTLNIKISFQI